MSIIRRENSLHDIEAKSLAPYAVHSGKSRGRKHIEGTDPTRTAFQRDRDRVIHSRSFRRLKEKTQVFLPSFGDHFRNRLIHSMEVAQVGRDVARSLGLNEDLCEVIGLAHDLGHTPFGHSGEWALDDCLRRDGLSFEHNEQSRRLVEEVEHVYPAHKGLNLSIEVIEGLMKHESMWDKPDKTKTQGIVPSLEAQVVNLSDEIAYQNHDTDDGLRSGILNEDDLMDLPLWRLACDAAKQAYGEIPDEHVRRARRVSKMIGIMIADLTEHSAHLIEEAGVSSLEDVYARSQPLIAYSPEMAAMNKELKDFLMARLYLSPVVKEAMDRGQAVVRALYSKLRESMEPEALRDYLSGMTDRFAVELAQELGLELE